MQNLALLQGAALGVKGVGRRQFDAIEKSAAQIFAITKIDAMFLCIYGWQMRYFGHVVV